MRGFGWRFGKLSRARKESNRWLSRRAAAVQGNVLSVGSGTDEDGEGKKYRDYFTAAVLYQTSDIDAAFSCDLQLDIRAMRQIPDASFDSVFCNGVLEHVDEFQSALEEMTRVLKTGGILLLGVPFRQPIHAAPNDYWRFTEEGIRHLLEPKYVILEIHAVDVITDFPSAYWIEARKR